jgi:hypothetical protein
VAFGVERGWHFYREAGYPATVSGLRLSHVVSWPELVSAPAEKLVARWPNAHGDEYADAVRAIVGVSLAVTSSGVRGLVEFSAAGIDKASGLAYVADEVGVSAGDVIAFGDMPNDLPMLRWAGRGVAVEWSHPAVCREISRRTPTKEAGGVAAYLEQLLGLRTGGRVV